MMAQSLKRWLAGAALAVSLALGTQASAANLSIRTLAAEETRLATVGYRIAVANAAVCRVPTMMSGLVVHDLTQYPIEARPLVARAFALREGVGVLGIIPGSGAQRAGLRIDDEIVGVGGKSIENGTAWTQHSPSYDQVDRFLELLSASLEVGSTKLLVRRNDQLVQLTLTGELGCGGSVKLVDSSSVNAWSDGRHVVLNSGIARMARSDDEIAFVIAHEMAHNILGHSTSSASESRALFGQLFGTGTPKNAEIQADVASISLMQAAGFAPEGGLSFLETARRKMWWVISFDHPSFGSRIRTVVAAIARNRSLDLSHYRLASLPVSVEQTPTMLAAAPVKAPAMLFAGSTALIPSMKARLRNKQHLKSMAA